MVFQVIVVLRSREFLMGRTVLRYRNIQFMLTAEGTNRNG